MSLPNPTLQDPQLSCFVRVLVCFLREIFQGRTKITVNKSIHSLDGNLGLYKAAFQRYIYCHSKQIRRLSPEVKEGAICIPRANREAGVEWEEPVSIHLRMVLS